MTEPPYDELDPPIAPLVRELSMFPGIVTLGSCGGHEKPISGNSAPANEWWVTFHLEPADDKAIIAVPSEDAWVSLEFLAYFFENLGNAGHGTALVTSSPPPFMNFPGRMLRFALQGWRDAKEPTEPEAIAEQLRSAADEYFVPAADAWGDDGPEEG